MRVIARPNYVAAIKGNDNELNDNIKTHIAPIKIYFKKKKLNV